MSNPTVAKVDELRERFEILSSQKSVARLAAGMAGSVAVGAVVGS